MDGFYDSLFLHPPHFYVLMFCKALCESFLWEVLYKIIIIIFIKSS